MKYPNLSDNDYILFVGQEANFQTRTMLIPAKKFLSIKENKEKYELLKTCADQKILNGVSIENVIYLTFDRSDGGYDLVTESHSKLCGEFLQRACDYRHVLDEDEYIEEWYKEAFTNLTTGFDHVNNYLECIKITQYMKTSINIIDSFLILNNIIYTTCIMDCKHSPERCQHVYNGYENKLKCYSCSVEKSVECKDSKGK